MEKASKSTDLCDHKLGKLQKINKICLQVWPDEVQQGVSRGHDRPWARMVIIFLRAGSWVDDEHQYDAYDDSDEGRPQVIGDGQDPQTAARLCVHGWEARHKTGWKKVEVFFSFLLLEKFQNIYFK